MTLTDELREMWRAQRLLPHWDPEAFRIARDKLAMELRRIADR